MWSVTKPRITQQAPSLQVHLPQVTQEMRQAMMDTARLPRPLSPLIVWSVTAGGTFFCFVLAMFTQAVFDHRWHFPLLSGVPMGHAPVMVLVIAAMLRFLLYQAQRRRQAMINRFLVVAEANHHIRNALTVLMGANCYFQETGRREIDRDLPKTYAQMQQAIERIELTLAEVLPQLDDKN